MHVILVGPEFEENLSLRYLAAALQAAGHTASMARFDSTEYLEGIVQQILREQPDLVGLSMVFQVRAREFFTLTRMLRKAGYSGHITAGGHFATFAYRSIFTDLPELDSIVRQEGENTLVELADALARQADRQALTQIPGLVLRSENPAMPILGPARQQVGNLDLLPFPVRAEEPERHLGVPTAFMVGSRGCYADCEYCSIFAWHEAALGKRYRMRSVANIAEEMERLYYDRGVRFFVFHDDNFFLPKPEGNRKRFEALRTEIRTRKLDDIGLMLKLRPNDCDRENMLILKDIGLLRAFVGIENAGQRQLRSLGRDSTVEDVNACLHMLRELDIYATYNILLFDPYTTLDDIAANLAFLRQNPYFPFNWCKVEPYAGTELEKRYGREGRLRGDYLGYDYTMDDPRTRQMYDLLLPAFYYRNFDYYGLANVNIGLGYHRQLLKHFYPEHCSIGLCRRVQHQIEAINHSALDLMERTYRFIREVDLEDQAAITRFETELKQDSFAIQHTLAAQVETILQEIETAAGVRQSTPVGISEAFTPLAPAPADAVPPPVAAQNPEQPTPSQRRRFRIPTRLTTPRSPVSESPSASRITMRDANSSDPGRRNWLVLSGSALVWLFTGGWQSQPTQTGQDANKPPQGQTSDKTKPAPKPPPPSATLKIAPGHPSKIKEGETFTLEAVLHPNDLVVVGKPRITTTAGKIESVHHYEKDHRLHIVFRPHGGSAYDPNLIVTTAWTVHGKDTDTVIVVRMFVHINTDSSHEIGYSVGVENARPTIAEMAAPPLTRGPKPGKD